MVLLIFLIFLLFLLLSLKAEGERISVISNGRLLKTETKDYYETWQAGSPIEMPAMASNRPATPSDDIKTYIRVLWGNQAETMIKIVACESNFRSEAINWQDATITGWPSQGIAQINAPYNEELFNWKYNLNVAFEMYQRRGFQPWSCYLLIQK